MKKIGYVCTTGPSLNSIETINKLFELGLTTVRFNMSYREKCMIDELTPQIISSRYDIKTMVDLCGPEIRIDISEPINITKDSVYLIGKDIKVKEGNIDILNVGDTIVFGDGEISFKIIEKDEYLKCISLNNGVLKRNKKITNESLCKTIPFLSESDINDIKHAIELNIDYLCVSFVNTVKDIEKIKEITNDKIKIVAKIETVEGVTNLKDILSEVDGIMIGRGDLGVRYPLSELGKVQKYICKIVKDSNKKLIVGTGFLSSMKENEIPTRAEVNDLYNTILDGADEIMFSGETASSNSPEDVLKTANKIAETID